MPLEGGGEFNDPLNMLRNCSSIDIKPLLVRKLMGGHTVAVRREGPREKVHDDPCGDLRLVRFGGRCG